MKNLNIIVELVESELEDIFSIGDTTIDEEKLEKQELTYKIIDFLVDNLLFIKNRNTENQYSGIKASASADKFLEKLNNKLKEEGGY